MQNALTYASTGAVGLSLKGKPATTVLFPSPQSQTEALYPLFPLFPNTQNSPALSIHYTNFNRFVEFKNPSTGLLTPV